MIFQIIEIIIECDCDRYKRNVFISVHIVIGIALNIMPFLGGSSTPPGRNHVGLSRGFTD